MAADSEAQHASVTAQPPRLPFDIFRRIQPHEYFRRFIEQNVRPDGRPLHKFRKTTLTVGAISTADGSAMVRIGGTTVICGIKAEISEPKIRFPEEGYLVPNVELSPICSPKFRPGPPSEQAQVASEFLNKIMESSKIVSLKDLCIEPSKAVWVLYADVLCLSYDGNVLDASLLALVAALLDLKIPSVTYSDDTVRAHPSNPPTRLRLSRIPVSTTLCLFASRLLSDPCDAEESLADENVTVTIDERGRMCHIWKMGGGSSAVTPELLKKCVATARTRYEDIRSVIEKAFQGKRDVFGREEEMELGA